MNANLMDKVGKTLLFILIVLAPLVIVMPFAESSELSADIKAEPLSPIPLLRILAKEKKMNNGDIYVISMKHIKDSDEIVSMYLESSGCLVTSIFRKGDERKRANELYQYDVMIPHKEIRRYYKERAPTAEMLIEKIESFLKKREERKQRVKGS